MDESVTDGQLIDVRGVDITDLLAGQAELSMRTALDRVFLSSPASCEGWNNSI